MYLQISRSMNILSIPKSVSSYFWDNLGCRTGAFSTMLSGLMSFMWFLSSLSNVYTALAKSSVPATCKCSHCICAKIPSLAYLSNLIKLHQSAADLCAGSIISRILHTGKNKYIWLKSTLQNMHGVTFWFTNKKVILFSLTSDEVFSTLKMQRVYSWSRSHSWKHT